MVTNDLLTQMQLRIFPEYPLLECNPKHSNKFESVK
jgi:hypothetical protein